MGFTYTQLFGLVSEADYPYTSGNVSTFTYSGSSQYDGFEFLNSGLNITFKIIFQFGQTGTCDYSPDAMDTVASLRGYETLPRNDYAAVMNHLATVGPLSVAGKQTAEKM